MDTDVSCVEPWRVEAVRGDTTLEVKLFGEHSWADADELPSQVLARADRVERVRFDLADVGIVDSALLRALLRCQALLAPTGVPVTVRRASDHARRLFEVTRLESLLEPEAEVADA